MASGLPSVKSTLSFWHTQPDSNLKGHRTTSQLPSYAETVIIGSGITGAVAAREILCIKSLKPPDVLMLEAREACWGATGRNGGHCLPAIYPSSEEVAKFELGNLSYLRQIVKNHDVACDWRDVSGVHAYMDDDLFQAASKQFEDLKASCPELTENVKRIDKKSENPSLQDLQLHSAVGAFVQKDAASLWPYKLTSTPVKKIMAATDGSGMWTLETNRGIVTANKVLVACNGYSSYLLPEFSQLLVPVRGQVSSLIPKGNSKDLASQISQRSRDHSYVFLGHGAKNISQDEYLIYRSNIDAHSSRVSSDQYIFGGARSVSTHAGVGIFDDSVVETAPAVRLRDELPKVLSMPGEGKLAMSASHEWTGIMGFSRDRCPWVGPVPVELGGGAGLFICAGFTGHGMPNASLCAKAAAAMMTGSPAYQVDLPSTYRISKERVKFAKNQPEVSAFEIAQANISASGQASRCIIA